MLSFARLRLLGAVCAAAPCGQRWCNGFCAAAFGAALCCAFLGRLSKSICVHLIEPVTGPLVFTIGCLAVTGSDQAYRAISTGQLNALLRLHLRPIDVVVFHGSQGRSCFEGGFPLRCLQRLSCPNIATQHYRWHDNWSTSGSFTPVLSY